MEPQEQRIGRPGGVTALGILAIVWGIVSLCGGSLLLLGDNLLARRIALRTGEPPRAFAALILVLSLILLVQAMLYIIFGVGALQLNSWAWTLGIVLALVGIVARVAALFLDHRPSSVIGDVIGIAIDAIVLIYLFQPRVRQAFRQP